MGKTIERSPSKVEAATRQMMRTSVALARRQRDGKTSPYRTALVTCIVRAAMSLSRSTVGWPKWMAGTLVAINIKAEDWTVRS
jgi:hypothetical protein